VLRIRITLEAGSESTIHIRVKNRIPIKVKWGLDPNLHQIQNSEAKEAKNGAMEGRQNSQWRRGGSKWSREGLQNNGRIFPSFLRGLEKIRIRICIKSAKSDPYHNQS
jgi:hypothetical protein